MSVRTRLTALVLTTTAVFVAAVAPAGAQAPDTYYIGADAATAKVTVLGNDIGTFAGTAVVAEHLPAVSATSFGLALPGDVKIGGTTATVSAAGSKVRDPDGSDHFCGVPEIPAEIPVAALLSLAEVCSSSLAALSNSASPEAASAAEAGRVAVNGQLLADLIFGLLLDPIMEQLAAITGPLEDAVLAPLDDALLAVCDAIPAELNPTQVVDAAEQTGLPVGDVIAALPNGSEIVAAIDDDCLLALATLVDLVGVSADLLEETVKAALLDALDRDLLEIVLGSALSTITPADGDMVARAEIEALSISTLSLQFLLDIIDEVVIAALQGVIDDAAAIIPEQLSPVVDAIPAVDAVLAPILDLLDLTGLIDDEPLLQLTLASGIADARAPLGGGTADTSNSSVGVITLKISTAIATLLGIPAETTVAPGVSEVFAEGTPLESTLSVGAIEQLTETLGSGNVATTGVKVSASEISLLTGIEGGIVLAVGPASARIGGTTPATTVTTLPRTGADLPTVGLVIMLTLGMGVLVGRRRLTI